MLGVGGSIGLDLHQAQRGPDHCETPPGAPHGGPPSKISEPAGVGRRKRSSIGLDLHQAQRGPDHCETPPGAPRGGPPGKILEPAGEDQVAAYRQEHDHVVLGSRSVLADEDRVPCGILASKSLQWLWIADTLGFDPEWCVLGTQVGNIDWIRATYPKTSFLRRPNLLRPVSVIFCDLAPPPFVYDIPTLELVFHNLLPRRYPPKKWTVRSVGLSHSALGGLTLQTQHVRCSTLAYRKFGSVPSPPALASCVYTVASDTTKAGIRANAPRSRRMGVNQVTPIGGSRFHGGGLYPLLSPGSARQVFLLPFVHQYTRWCYRRLTSEEEWMVYDVLGGTCAPGY